MSKSKHQHTPADTIPTAVTAPFVVEAVVFLCGAVVMILELVGSRLLAPYFGNSIFVWTSLIGVMLGFMALGNYLGGRLGDKYLSTTVLFWILVSASLSVSLIAFTEGLVIPLLGNGSALRTEAVASAIVLFALPSTIFGMVSPYSIRLRMHAISDSGATVGSLYAISTLGSIVGTFAAGFWLIALIGSHSIIMWVAGVPLALSALFFMPLDARRVAAFGVAVILILLAALFSKSSVQGAFDTQYERYMIRRGTDTRSGRPVVGLSPNIDGGSETIVYADNGEPLVTPYFMYLDLALKLAPRVNRTLLIGGGAFAYPRHQFSLYPNSTTDVVEIDPQLVQVSKRDFFLKDDPRTKIITEDGRTYLDRNTATYDVVILDAFKGKGSVPYQLATRESMQHVYHALSGKGILVMNLLGSYGGSDKRFIEAEYATLKSVFPRVEVYAAEAPGDPQARQNLMIIAAKDPTFDIQGATQRLAPDLAANHLANYAAPAGTRIITDDYAPVDQYLAGL